MIPYGLLNGVALSWCSLIGRLIKRHDLWLINAESVINEIHFNLQGERGAGGERQAGEICWGHCWHAIICKAGMRGLYGVSPRQRVGQAEPGLAPKPPARFFPQSHMANPELVSQLEDNRNQCSSSHLLLHLMLLITLMDCVAIKKTRGGCQPGGLFFLQDVKEWRSEMQTASEWSTHLECELYHPWEMGLCHPQAPKGLHRKEESSPALSTTAEKVGSKASFYWSKPSFHIYAHFCRA